MRRGACFGLGPGGDDGRVCCPSRGASACRQNAWRSSSATTPMRTPALQKAVNDSEAISQELAKLGFDVVSAECRTPRHEPRSRRARKQDRERRRRAHLFRRTWLCRRRHQLPFAGRCACRRSWREGLMRDASLRRTASQEKGRSNRDPYPRCLPRQSVRASRQAQHRAHPRGFAHGSG